MRSSGDGAIRPELDLIADFSNVQKEHWNNYRQQCNHAARQFLLSFHHRDDLGFSFTMLNREEWKQILKSHPAPTFSAEILLIQAGNASYRYDVENQRVGVNQTRYIINCQPPLSQVLVKESNRIKTFYVYGLGLIGEETDGAYRSYHFDYRESTVALTNEIGQVTERFQYAPYGELVSGDSSQTPFLFNGLYEVMTDDNGLYYMRARFYSPEIKRFINQDILLGNVVEETLNQFVFVTRNPVSFIDPFGLTACYVFFPDMPTLQLSLEKVPSLPEITHYQLRIVLVRSE